MKHLMNCTRGDIVSRRGEVLKIYSVYCSAQAPGLSGTVEVYVAKLTDLDTWMSERYPRTYPTDQQVRLLGHEE